MKLGFFFGLLLHALAGLCGFNMAVACAVPGATGVCRDVLEKGRGKDAAVLVESPGGSCNISRHLGRQIAKAEMETAKLPVLKGCPRGPGS